MPVAKTKQIEEDLKKELAELKQLKAELAETKKELEKLTEEQSARLAESIAAMEDAEFNIVNGKVEGLNIKVMTPDEYKAYSAEQGRIMGRDPKQKTQCSIEELRALINSNWTPKMIMEKHGMDAEDFKQLVWRLSKKELRDVPIKYSIEGNFISKEA